MDTMIQHPGTELQLLIKEKGLTQKAFASILGKKISEVNELLKGKRNITIQRDYLLHQALGTPIKYRILKQIDYDYSLLDIDESIQTDDIIPNHIEESSSDGDSDNFKQEENIETENSSSETKNLQNDNNVDNEIGQKNSDEDFKERAQIFKSF